MAENESTNSDSTHDSRSRVSALSTSRADVTLRTYNRDMNADLVYAANHREIARFMSDRFPFPYTVEDASEWISITLEEPEPLNYAVFVEDRIVGGVGAVNLGQEQTGTFEIGWWLTPDCWGRGITSAAARALVDELFKHRGAMTLWAPVMAPNRGSAGVARKLGMVLEGTRESVYCKGGVRYDQLDFGLTRQRWASS